MAILEDMMSFVHLVVTASATYTRHAIVKGIRTKCKHMQYQYLNQEKSLSAARSLWIF